MLILVFQKIVINFSIIKCENDTMTKVPSTHLSFGMGMFTYLQCVSEETAISLIVIKKYMGKFGEITC